MTAERRKLIALLDQAPLQVINKIKLQSLRMVEVSNILEKEIKSQAPNNTVVSNCIESLAYYIQTEPSSITAKELVDEWQRSAYNADCQSSAGGSINSTMYSAEYLVDISSMTFKKASKILSFNFQY